MSEPVRRDVELPSADDPSSALPEHHGWVLWAGGRCSIVGCADPPAMAVERAARGRRPAYWQAYCATHAHARGVERVEDELVWTAEFLAPPGRAMRPKPTS